MSKKVIMTAVALALVLSFTAVMVDPSSDASATVPDALGSNEYMDLAYYADSSASEWTIDVTLKVATTPHVTLKLYKDNGSAIDTNPVATLGPIASGGTITMMLTAALDGSYQMQVVPNGTGSTLTCDLIITSYLLSFGAETKEGSTVLSDSYAYTFNAASNISGGDGDGGDRLKIQADGYVTANGQTLSFKNVKGNEITVTVTAPTATDKDDKYTYTFEGWFAGSDLLNPTYQVKGASQIVAKWTVVIKSYNVSFDSGTIASVVGPEGTGQIVVSATGTDVPYGTELTVTANAVAGSTVTNYKNGKAIDTAALVSKYTVAAEKAYFSAIAGAVVYDNVTFDANGGTFGNESTQKIDQTYGAKYQLPAVDPTLTGYEFSGWFLNLGVSGETQIKSDTVVPVISEAQTIKAKWTVKTYLVTFDSNKISVTASGSVTSGDRVDFGTELTIAPTAAALTGKDNQTTEKTATLYANGVALSGTPLKYVVDENHMVDVEFTISVENAVYKDSSAAVFVGNFDGSSYSISVAETYDTRFVLPANIPTRVGYDFAGWFTEASDGTQVTDQSIVAKADKGQTFYAHWNVQSYKVTFDSSTVSVKNGNDDVSSGASVYYGTVLTIAPKYTDKFPAEGYVGTVAASIGTISGGSYTVGINDVEFTTSYEAKGVTLTFTGGSLPTGVTGSITYKEDTKGASATVTATVLYGTILYIDGSVVKFASTTGDKSVQALTDATSSSNDYRVKEFKVSTAGIADGYKVVGNTTVAADFEAVDRGVYNLSASISGTETGLTVAVSSKVSKDGAAVMVITNDGSIGLYTYGFQVSVDGGSNYKTPSDAGVEISSDGIGYGTYKVTGITADTKIKVTPTTTNSDLGAFYVDELTLASTSATGTVKVVIESNKDIIAGPGAKMKIGGVGIIERTGGKTAYINLANATATVTKVDGEVATSVAFNDKASHTIVYGMTYGSKNVSLYSAFAEFLGANDVQIGLTKTVLYQAA